jgi:hypothetical protein
MKTPVFWSREEGTVYSLDYNMVIQVLQQFRYSGEVHADVPLQVKLREGGRVILMVYNGVVRSCFILDRNGQKLYHDAEAQRLLPKLGVLEWKLVPFTSPPLTKPAYPPSIAPPFTKPAYPPSIAPPRNPSNGAHFYPRRRDIPQAQMRIWSVLQRSVYLLSDGTRNQEQIAALLSRPLNLIEQTISELQQLGVIEK